MAQNEKGPLGLSKGSVRSIAFLALVGAAIGGFFAGLIPNDSFLPLVTMAATFYFTSRETAAQKP